MKKLQLKSDAEPTLFDYSKKGDGEKRKASRSTGALVKRKKLETLSEVLVEQPDDTVDHGEENDTNGTDVIPVHDEKVSNDENTSPDKPSQACYNVFTQTLQVDKRTFGCQVNPQTFDVGTQTSTPRLKTPSQTMEPHYDFLEESSAEKEMIHHNISDANDPGWTPCQNTDVPDCNEGVQRETNAAQERKFIVFESCLHQNPKQGSQVKIGGDARCCTPGHTAKYGSYSIMDLERNKVIDTQLVQSNEVPNSYHMELEGLKRCMAVLDDNGIHAVNLVTDRHPSVKKYMRLERPDVNHLFDVWHVAKGVYKKLELIGKKKTKGFDVVGLWARSASNHIYWCAASSNGDAEMVRQKWTSILNHVTNIHEGHGSKFQRCEHDVIEDREWIKKGGKAYQAMEKVVRGNLLQKDIGKLSPAEQTSSLESYHRVVCFFAPKSVHYMHHQMEARLYLEGFHFNENSSRAQAATSTGRSQYRVSYPKSRRGEGVAKEVKVEATYGYVQDLFEDLLFRRNRFPSYSQAADDRAIKDKRRPPPLSYSTPHKPKDEIV